MHKVSRRGGFSDRNGIKPENVEIQLKDFDKRTRIQIFNLICEVYEVIYGDVYYDDESVQDFFRYVYAKIYAQLVNIAEDYDEEDVFDDIRETLMDDEYDSILTLVEAIAQYWACDLKSVEIILNIPFDYSGQALYEKFNDVFKREYVGYRFIDGIIVPISDDVEVLAVKDALNNNYKPVREHIAKANTLLADREKPDYENSIKESISAVEAICEIITENDGKSATLGKLLKKLEDGGVYIHPALQSAFSCLYGYTSDASGIRHAKDMGGKDSTFEEAKYMLVACSAFVNYLIALNAD